MYVILTIKQSQVAVLTVYAVCDPRACTRTYCVRYTYTSKYQFMLYHDPMALHQKPSIKTLEDILFHAAVYNTYIPCLVWIRLTFFTLRTLLDSSCDYACGYLFIHSLWVIAGNIYYSSPPGIVNNFFFFVLIFLAPGLLSWRLEYCFIRDSKCTSSPRIHLHPSMYVFDTVCVCVCVCV